MASEPKLKNLLNNFSEKVGVTKLEPLPKYSVGLRSAADRAQKLLDKIKKINIDPTEKKKFGGRKGLYANIHAKRKRGEKMRKKGAKGAPTAAQFKRAKQTARKR